MPGKIFNSVWSSYNGLCKVIGNHNGITMAGSHGHFELNVFKPLLFIIFYNQ